MTTIRTPEDETVLEQIDPPFSPLTMFVCTFEAVLGNINWTHEDLIKHLEPRGAIKALNCNYGHKVQLGYERFGKWPKLVAEPRAAPVECCDHRRPIPAVVRQRKPQGDATCFNSALEVTVIPGPEDNPPAAVQAYFAQNPDKHYAVKSFPTTGKTQVPGVVCAGLEDGAFIARLWAKFLTEAGVATNSNEPITVVEERPIMLNFKYFLYRRSERIILNLSAITEHLEAAKTAYEFEERTRGMDGAELAANEAAFKAANIDAWLIYVKAERCSGLPFPVREIKHVQDGQNISFKFMGPSGKKVRINIFYRGKVNILGASDFEMPKAIYAYLSALVLSHWEELVSIQPLPDRVYQTRAAANLMQKTPVLALPPDRTVAAENALKDDDLDALLDEVKIISEKKVPALDMTVRMAQGFEVKFGANPSEDSPLD